MNVIERVFHSLVRSNACAKSGRLARHESEPAPASTGPARDPNRKGLR